MSFFYTTPGIITLIIVGAIVGGIIGFYAAKRSLKRVVDCLTYQAAFYAQRYNALTYEIEEMLNDRKWEDNWIEDESEPNDM